MRCTANKVRAASGSQTEDHCKAGFLFSQGHDSWKWFGTVHVNVGLPVCRPLIKMLFVRSGIALANESFHIAANFTALLG